MTILEICGLLGIPLSIIGWIGSVFLSAYTNEKGIKAAWKIVRNIFIALGLIALFIFGLICLIYNAMKINPNSLNLRDVITICAGILTITLIPLCITLYIALKKICSKLEHLGDTIEKILKFIRS